MLQKPLGIYYWIACSIFWVSFKQCVCVYQANITKDQTATYNRPFDSTFWRIQTFFFLQIFVFFNTHFLGSTRITVYLNLQVRKSNIVRKILSTTTSKIIYNIATPISCPLRCLRHKYLFSSCFLFFLWLLLYSEFQFMEFCTYLSFMYI